MGRVVAVDLCNTVAAVNAAIAACLGLGAGWVWETYSLEPAGIRDAEAWFRGHPEVFAEAEPVPGAAEALDGLAAAGWEIVYLTARPEWARGLSVEWLRRRGFPQGRLVMTQDKAAACTVLGISAAVEDSPEQIRALSRVVPVYAPAQPYNGSPLGWWEIVRMLERRFPRTDEGAAGRRWTR
ncbi:MAG: hypothetical protein AB1609_10610 [Bacillota bacterium]